MKRNGKYRFSLQFGAETEEQIRVGDLLERLGNKKSIVVLAAMNEYIESHPEIAEGKIRIEVSASTKMDKDEVERMVRIIVKEQLLEGTDSSIGATSSTTAQECASELAQMLNNIDMF